MSVSGFVFNDAGYRLGENETRGRFTIGTRIRSEKIAGLSYGLNGNVTNSTGGLFFVWHNADSVLFPQGLLDTSTSTLAKYSNWRIIVDPYVEYFTTNGSRHSLKTRFYRTVNNGAEGQGSNANSYYLQYQWQNTLQNGLKLIRGISSNLINVHSELYGNNGSSNFAGFLQADYKWNKLNLSGGGRFEYFNVNELTSSYNLGRLKLPVYPVFRAGVAYEVAKATFLRASWGQGYRFPSIGERYVKTVVGVLGILPNPSVQPETGWSSEIGLKQGFKISNWSGYLDAAYFYSEYKNMVEFTFGNYAPEGTVFSSDPNDPNYFYNWVGFRSENMENARVQGLDLSVVGKGKVGKVEIITLMGYTYINPSAINPDSSYLESYSNPNSKLLKYRFRHLGKMDVQFGYRKLMIGFSSRYNSFMENIDKTFVQNAFGTLSILPGLAQYREAQFKNGDWIFDVRFGVDIFENAKLLFNCNNLLNREVMGRPGDIQPPRNYSLQLTLKL